MCSCVYIIIMRVKHNGGITNLTHQSCVGGKRTLGRVGKWQESNSHVTKRNWNEEESKRAGSKRAEGRENGRGNEGDRKE